MYRLVAICDVCGWSRDGCQDEAELAGMLFSAEVSTAIVADELEALSSAHGWTLDQGGILRCPDCEPTAVRQRPPWPPEESTQEYELTGEEIDALFEAAKS